MATASSTYEVDEVPPLVRVLAGNSVTSTIILASLVTTDTGPLRRLHPAVLGAVAGVPWCDVVTPVVDVVRWRAALRSAVGARLTCRAVNNILTGAGAVALVGTTHLDAHGCSNVTDELLCRLPASLRELNVRGCGSLTARAGFAHLPALAVLDTRWIKVCLAVDRLPTSLHELDLSHSPAGSVSLAHLTHLRVLRASRDALDAAMLASLPAGLEELDVTWCMRLRPAASFAHLRALRTLAAAHAAITDASLAGLPPSLVRLTIRGCHKLTSAAALPHLPALRVLDASDTNVGDALVGSLPAGLEEAQLSRCSGVTVTHSSASRLDHLHALRALFSIDTNFPPATLAACRARGCIAPAAGVLRGHHHCVRSLVMLADSGRLASGDSGGEVRLWDGLVGHTKTVAALAVLPDGTLASGSYDFMVRLWNTGACVCVATLGGHTAAVCALAVLADGRLASGAGDGLRLWEVGATTTTCDVVVIHGVAAVASLAALPDGRLVGGCEDGTIRLWDTRPAARAANAGSSRAAGTGPAAVLGQEPYGIESLVVLPDGRLVSAGGARRGSLPLLDVPPLAATAT